MAKDVINVDGKDVVVREDTAKAYRGVNWALLSIALFILIIAVVAATFFMSSGVQSPTDPPSRGTTAQ